MKIKYKKRRSKFYLVMIVLWSILLILNLLYGERENWTFWLWSILPITYIAYYSWEYVNQYLIIENGFIYRNSLFPKKLELKKVKNTKKFAGDYIIETDHNILRIDTSLIDGDSLKILDGFLWDNKVLDPEKE